MCIRLAIMSIHIEEKSIGGWGAKIPRLENFKAGDGTLLQGTRGGGGKKIPTSLEQNHLDYQ